MATVAGTDLRDRHRGVAFRTVARRLDYRTQRAHCPLDHAAHKEFPEITANFNELLSAISLTAVNDFHLRSAKSSHVDGELSVPVDLQIPLNNAAHHRGT